MSETKICEQCGGSFLPTSGLRRFCSRRCIGQFGALTKSPKEMLCKVEDCGRRRITAKFGFCRYHDYRYRYYGDPLADTKRNRKRDERPTRLDVDWEKLENTEKDWKRNPTHCPKGHPYDEENTYIRTTREGAVRRLCRTCSSEATLRWQRGEKPDRTATCVECGISWEGTRFGMLPKRCQPCAIDRHRQLARLRQAKNRKQSPKGPTYTCTQCGVVSKTRAVPGMAPRLCDACEEANRNETKRKTWRQSQLSKYNISEEEYLALEAQQGGRCKICGTEDPGGSVRRWHIDHDHNCCPPGRSCGRCIRGLLCSRCNRAIGWFKDDPGLLASALAYLEGKTPSPDTP